MSELDFREIIRFIVIGGGAAVLALSYVAAYLMGKNAARKELERRDARGVSLQSDRLDGVEAAVESIALGVERLGEGQRYLLGSLTEQRRAKPVAKPERRHTTPV
jgi:hypothetical protein